MWSLYQYGRSSGWPQVTLPLPDRCEYCGRDGGTNFMCDGCGAPRRARASTDDRWSTAGPEFVDVTTMSDWHTRVLRVR